MSNPADVYMDLALWAIKLSQSPSSLRYWWSEEKEHRTQYGLSQDQIDRLIAASKAHISELEERSRDSAPEITKPERSRRRPTPPRVAI